DVVSWAVAVRAVAVANHERPVDHPPVSVPRCGVPVAQRPSHRRGDDESADAVLAARCRRPGVGGADRGHRAALPAEVHPPLATGAGPIRHVATHVEESAVGRRVVKSFGREDYVFDRFDKQATKLYNIGVQKVAVTAKFWTLLEVIPNLTLIVVLSFGAYAAGHRLITMGTLGALIAMTLSLV